VEAIRSRAHGAILAMDSRSRPPEFCGIESDQMELLFDVSSRPRSPWHPLSPRIALGVTVGSTLFHDVPTGSAVLVSATTYVSGREVDFIGPALDAALVKNFFIEVDAFYHPIEVSTRTVLSNGEVVDSFSGAEGRTFEFPVLGKYQFGTGRVKPFVEVGPSFRLLTENSSLFGISAGHGARSAPEVSEDRSRASIDALGGRKAAIAYQPRSSRTKWSFRPTFYCKLSRRPCSVPPGRMKMGCSGRRRRLRMTWPLRASSHLLILYGIKSNGPWMVSLASLVLASIAALSGFLPARRASRLDPMAALREE
jgi:hypothetical protein